MKKTWISSAHQGFVLENMHSNTLSAFRLTAEKLSGIPGYKSKCFVYTGNFSDENIASIRRSGCKLAAISLNERNAADAFRHHPDMAEYPHTSDFQAIDNMIINKFRKIK